MTHDEEDWLNTNERVNEKSGEGRLRKEILKKKKEVLILQKKEKVSLMSVLNPSSLMLV